MRPYWVVRNVAGEDVPLKIRLWSGQEVDDVFHADEVVVIHKYDAIAVLRYIDPAGAVFAIEMKMEYPQKINWQKEGF